MDNTADADTGMVQRFEAIVGGPPAVHLISSATVTKRGAHDIVKLWTRGGLAGELTLAEGDGTKLALLLKLGAVSR